MFLSGYGEKAVVEVLGKKVCKNSGKLPGSSLKLIVLGQEEGLFPA